MHRFVWDLHYPAIEGQSPEYPISAIYRDTQRNPLGPWAHPGTYTVKLSIGKNSTSEPLIVKMDPRVATTPAGLKQQFSLSMSAYGGMKSVREALQAIQKIKAQLKDLKGRTAQGSIVDSIASVDHLSALSKARSQAGDSAVKQAPPNRISAGFLVSSAQ
jgi:hypothetical protein